MQQFFLCCTVHIIVSITDYVYLHKCYLGGRLTGLCIAIVNVLSAKERHKTMHDWASNKKVGYTISKFLNQDNILVEEFKRSTIC